MPGKEVNTTPIGEYDDLRLDRQLCFPLYACAREVMKQYTPYLAALDLTYTQYVTMLVVWEYGSLTVKKAGDILHLDSGTLTPLFKKLEEKGLVDRRRSKEDERNLIVSVTKKGLELRDRAVAIPAQLNAHIGLSPRKLTQLYGLLYDLLDSLD